MNNLNKYSGIIIAVLAVAVVVLAAMLLTKSQNNTSVSSLNSSSSSTVDYVSTTTPTSSALVNQAAGKKTTVPVSKPAPTGFTIHFITPVANDLWTITLPNSIVWDREAGVTGEIELLDASTMKLAGVILNQTGPHQTSYSWNTRDLFLNNTSPSKTTVVPGHYVIRIIFNGNNLSPITSPVITIAQ